MGQGQTVASVAMVCCRGECDSLANTHSFLFRTTTCDSPPNNRQGGSRGTIRAHLDSTQSLPRHRWNQYATTTPHTTPHPVPAATWGALCAFTTTRAGTTGRNTQAYTRACANQRTMVRCWDAGMSALTVSGRYLADRKDSRGGIAEQCQTNWRVAMRECPLGMP